MAPMAFLLLYMAVWPCMAAEIICPYFEMRYTDRYRVLAIENHTFGRIDSDTFDGIHGALPSLESLILRNASIRMIASDTFSQLPWLKCLDLYHNILDVTDNLMFRGLRSLDTLIMGKNLLRDIRPSSFLYVQELKRLSLAKNLLGSLGSSAFRGLSKLEELDLSGNQLQFIHPLVFSHTPALKTLILSRNPLVYAGLTSLTSLGTFVADHTQFAVFPDFPMTTRDVDLRSANISSIQSHRSPDLWHFRQVQLSENPWNCSCDHYWFMQWLNYSTVAIDRLDVRCGSPLSLQGRTVLSVLQTITCPNQTANSSVTIFTHLKTDMIVRNPFLLPSGNNNNEETSKSVPSTTFIPNLSKHLPSKIAELTVETPTEPTVNDAVQSTIIRQGPFSPVPDEPEPVDSTPKPDDLTPVSNDLTVSKENGVGLIPHLPSPFFDETRSTTVETKDTPILPPNPSDDNLQVIDDNINQSNDSQNKNSTAGKRSDSEQKDTESAGSSFRFWMILFLSVLFGLIFGLLFLVAYMTALRCCAKRRSANATIPWTRTVSPMATINPIHEDVTLRHSGHLSRYNTLDSYVPKSVTLPDMGVWHSSRSLSQLYIAPEPDDDIFVERNDTLRAFSRQDMKAFT